MHTNDFDSWVSSNDESAPKPEPRITPVVTYDMGQRLVAALRPRDGRNPNIKATIVAWVQRENARAAKGRVK